MASNSKAGPDARQRRSRARSAEVTLDDYLQERIDAALNAHNAGSYLRAETTLERLERILGRLESQLDISSEGKGELLPEGVEARRVALRPPAMKILFISNPISRSDPTNFYLADSHLYKCIRGAFLRALVDPVPAGDRFLTYFRDAGCWLAAVPADRRRSRGRPRKDSRHPTAEFVADLLRQHEPTYVIGMAGNLEAPLHEAATLAGFPQERVKTVATPRALWEPKVIALLADWLSGRKASSRDLDSHHVAGLLNAIERTLHESEEEVLKPKTIAERIYQRGQFRGPKGFLSWQSVRAVAKRHPELFDVSRAGISLH